jgi:hypothetical protein
VFLSTAPGKKGSGKWREERKNDRSYDLTFVRGGLWVPLGSLKNCLSSATLLIRSYFLRSRLGKRFRLPVKKLMTDEPTRPDVSTVLISQLLW